MLRSKLATVYQAIQKRMADPRARRGLSSGIMLLSILFLLFILLRDVQTLPAQIVWQDYLGVCAIGLLLYLIPLLMHLAVWTGLMTRLGGVRGGWWHVEIFAHSHLLRRLPGVVWYVVGRTTMYRAQGVDANVPIVASGLEWLLLVAGSAVVTASLGLGGGAGLPAIASIGLILIVASALALGFLFTAVSGPNRNGRAANWLARLIAVNPPRFRDLSMWLGLYIVTYVLGGWILLLLVQGISPASGVDLLNMTQAWALVGGLGTLLSAIVPAGMGIRELSLTVVLSPYIGGTAGVLVSVLLRLLFMFADLVWGVALWSIARIVLRNPGATLPDISQIKQ